MELREGIVGKSNPQLVGQKHGNKVELTAESNVCVCVGGGQSRGTEP